MQLSEAKIKHLNALSNKNGVIADFHFAPLWL